MESKNKHAEPAQQYKFAMPDAYGKSVAEVATEKDEPAVHAESE